MAQQSICDNCGQARPTNRMTVAVSVFGAVRPEIVTGTEFAQDVCEECWPKASAKMAEGVAAQLFRDIPVHRDVQDVYEAMEPVQFRLKDAVKARDAIDEKATGAEKAKRLEFDAQVEKAVADLQALEDKRIALIRSVS